MTVDCATHQAVPRARRVTNQKSWDFVKAWVKVMNADRFDLQAPLQ
jgi:catalase (peroxidase I)